MFDISWTELIVVGVVALLVVGPKELPALLRTIGRYVGMIKQQAAEFRTQFEEAMRESELEQLKKEVENAGRDMAATVRDAGRNVETEIHDAKREFDQVGQTATPALDKCDAIVAPRPREVGTAGNGVTREETVNGAGAATSASQAGRVQAKPGA